MSTDDGPGTAPPRRHERRPQPAVRLAVSSAVAAALLAGCSGGGSTASGTGAGAGTAPTVTSANTDPSESGPSVADVFRDARTAALSAESGHAVGFVTSDGRRLRIDLEGQANGANQTVFITTPNAGVAEVLTVGTDYWVSGDEEHWADVTGDPKTARALVGRYTPATRAEATRLGAVTLRSVLTDAFAQPDLSVLESNTGAPTGTEVDGQAAYVLGAQGGARLWVAADGSSTLLRYVGPKRAPADLTFSEWGRATTFLEPPPDRVVPD